jgi:glycosyltransferase involved in cell wall biosynthesis
MKILLICKSLPIRSQGGIQTHVWKLSEHLIQLGHEVSILTAGSWKKGETRYDLAGRNIIEIPYLPLFRQPIMPVFLEEWSFNISAKWWLKRHETPFDIIHLQGRSGFLYPTSKHKTPIISTFHGLVSVENSRSMRKRTLEVILHERWANWYEKKIIKNSDALIAVSHEMLKEMQDFIGHNLDKIKIVSNGVSIKKAPFTPEIDKNLLVFIGRIDPIKGIFSLVQAMKKVKSPIHLVMIGDSFGFKSFEKHVYTEGVANRITLMGALPNDTVFEWINKSYAVILPSFHETQGIVLMEANACGKPVLASNVGGITEVVTHGENGFLFNPHDIDDIANAINTLFEMPEKAQIMGKNGKKRVEELYAWDKIALQTVDLYQKTIIDFKTSKEENFYKLPNERLKIPQVG